MMIGLLETLGLILSTAREKNERKEERRQGERGRKRKGRRNEGRKEEILGMTDV